MPTDIVGYTYKADLYCPRCIVRQVQRHRHTGAAGFEPSPADVEAILDRLAKYLHINRGDESTFDSGNFPKVVFRGMTQKPCAECDDPNCQQNLYASRCGSCGEVLGA